MKKSQASGRKRVLMVLTLFTLAFFLLSIRLFHIQVISAPRLQQMSKDQRERSVPISAKRGSIYDRNMSVLAMSASAKTVAVWPEVIKKEGNAELVANTLSHILELDRDFIYKKATQEASLVWVKRLITKEQEEKIVAAQATVKGIVLVEDTKRYYPMKNMLAQVIGYTTIDGVGQEGLEAKYNKYLAGIPGEQLVETDRYGIELPYADSRRVSPTEGFGLVTTIDSKIQSYVEKAIDECVIATKPKSVTAIVMDPKTGEVLAMAKKPDYDLNNPPRNDMSALLELSRNTAVLDVYEPGSTFKTITTAAALEENKFSLDSKFFCGGSKTVDGQKIKCWRSYKPHGSQTLTEGVCNSCNPVFMDMALELGKDKFYDYLDNFGFGQYTNIDFSSDEKGLVMAHKYVKNVDLARMGFGQAIAVTPIQLITAFSAVINGGDLMEPHLVKKIVDADGNTVRDINPTKVRSVISEQTSETMRGILEKVVSEGGGKNAYLSGYRIGGKTGTAQKYENGVIVSNKHVSSFIGFAPADDPKVAVLFVVDEPSCAIHFGSVVAAPYVKQILNDTLKDMGIQPQVIEGDEENSALTIAMPDVMGKNTTEAQKLLSELGLNVQVAGKGQITDQYPTAGEKLSVNATVAIKGNEEDTQDDYISMD